MNPIRDQPTMFYVYVIQDKNKRWHREYTSDLRKRFCEHNNKKSKYTKHCGPYKLIYCEACLHEKDARSKEKYLKSGR